MAKRVAFCLVENDNGQVLLVQRGFGKRSTMVAARGQL